MMVELLIFKRRVIRILVLIGKTSSGKDSVCNKLITDYGFHKIITYTTRPMRKGEEQDITYHFISEEEFKAKIESGFFAEWKTYTTVDGIWYYGTSVESLENADDKSVIILTPDGYKDILEKISYRPTSIYLYANNATIKGRLISRGDNKDEAERRLKHDNEDFKGIETLVSRIFYNNEGTNICDVTENIVVWLKTKEIGGKR